ncbi:hypothetical protein [Streptomyces sp. Tue6028]|uniref:hypothetical protein n=1 Tax=Streptomyces sp. Tue6028 TaxID=2036037 RepID=UPI003D747115
MGHPATGKFITYNEIVIVRFAGGRIAETRGVVQDPGKVAECPSCLMGSRSATASRAWRPFGESGPRPPDRTDKSILRRGPGESSTSSRRCDSSV